MKVPENPLNGFLIFLPGLAMYRLTNKLGQEQTITYIKEPTTLEYETREILLINAVRLLGQPRPP
jgi:hypothetical protein